MRFGSSVFHVAVLMFLCSVATLAISFLFGSRAISGFDEISAWVAYGFLFVFPFIGIAAGILCRRSRLRLVVSVLMLVVWALAFAGIWVVNGTIA